MSGPDLNASYYANDGGQKRGGDIYQPKSKC